MLNPTREVMRAICVTLIFGGVFSAEAIAAAAAKNAYASDCFPSPALDSSLVAYLSALLSANDSGAVALKARAGFGSVLPSQVATVQDSLICSRASEAQRLLLPAEHRGDLVPVVMARVGDERFVVYDGAQVGEFEELTVYDTAFTYIISIAK